MKFNKTVNLISWLIPLGVVPNVLAGDCLSHPLIIHELAIESCDLLTEGNAGEISRIATPAVVATRYHGAILVGKETRRRIIDIDGPNITEPTPMPWSRTNEAVKFLYSSNDPGICSEFETGTIARVLYATNCECDTGAHPDGYCALTVKEVSGIPGNILKHTQ